MNFDSSYYPYNSRRTVVYSNKGMVACSQHLAAQAGLDVMKRGGNAIDAAVAAAACLTVVEPTSNGIGGDAFAIVWSNGKISGLNSSGPAPMMISAESLKRSGYNEMPKYGWAPVTVPGIPAAWAELVKKFGKLSLNDDMRDAIIYAQEGFPVSTVVSRNWKRAYKILYNNLKDQKFKYWFNTFTRDGGVPEAGDMWYFPDHAKSLESIAETYGDSFYKGEIAERIDKFSKESGGYIRKSDLENFKPQWVEPLSINYRGYDVYEMPPNSQGIVALMALNILKGFEFTERDSLYTFHNQIEAIKLAFSDGLKYIADPSYMDVNVSELLSDAYADERRKQISKRASLPAPGTPPKGGTVYLAAADNDGNMISYIQSNYVGFGSGLVVPGTGIALHNRGNSFSLDQNHVNCIAPGKRPYHTIIPGFLAKDGKPVGPFGVMGAFMQPQGHVQVVMNTIDFNLNPQASLDAPRWQWIKDKKVIIEHGVPSKIAEGLSSLGHDICLSEDTDSFGRGQIIWKNDNGTLCGATEPRADGEAAAW